MADKITFEYAVSFAHYSGLGSVCLSGEWFDNFDSAYKYAQQSKCPFTVYFVVNRKWVFYCERSFVANEPYVLYNIRPFPGNAGRVETKIWWSEFIKAPQNFLCYAEAVLDNA